MRSRCRRSIITMSAPLRPSRMSRGRLRRRTARCRAAARGGRHHPHARAHGVEQDGCWSARRASAGCRRRSPPAGLRCLPLLRRMVSASSSACVGCSCEPSPALTTGATLKLARRTVAIAPESVVAHHQYVGVHGVERDCGVDQRLAFAAAMAETRRHIHHVGAQPFARQFERTIGCGWRLRRTD